MDDCSQLKKEEEWKEAYQLLCQLDPDLKEDVFLNTLREHSPATILLFGLRVGGSLRVTAVANTVHAIDGESVLWIFDMVTDESFRSQGLGLKLLQYMEAFAQDNGFTQVRVHSTFARERAHEFYTSKAGFSKWCVLFRKKLR